MNFAPHIRKWVDGIVYGRVASEHKAPHELDQAPTQWARNGHPMKFEDVIPKKWLAKGFVRKMRLTHVTFLDVCRQHGVRTEDGLWALAGEMEESGDRGLMSFLMENDVGVALDRAVKAMDAKEASRRSKLTRLDILQEYVDTQKCTCSTPGQCYWLIKDVLAKNGVDGEFQRQVVAALRIGREKGTNLCVVGGTNMAKSYVFKPLFIIFKTYTRPDGGSYQLEDLLGKEMVFLNDFEYDDSARKWMPWQYFKNFLEGEFVSVGRPKNRGGNAEFKSDAPVFMTAPQEVALYRGKMRDDYETSQMRARVSYIGFTHTFTKQQGMPDVKPCGHCGARVYLEGCVRAGAAAGPSSSSTSPASALPPPAKKTRLAMDIIKALGEAKALKDSGCIGSPELAKLKDKLFRGE